MLSAQCSRLLSARLRAASTNCSPLRRGLAPIFLRSSCNVESSDIHGLAVSLTLLVATAAGTMQQNAQCASDDDSPARSPAHPSDPGWPNYGGTVVKTEDEAVAALGGPPLGSEPSKIIEFYRDQDKSTDEVCVVKNMKYHVLWEKEIGFYSGQVNQNGRPDGSGKMVWHLYDKKSEKLDSGLMKYEAIPRTKEYNGEWKDGSRTGYGVMTGKKRYEGEWKDDREEGKGVVTWPNGERYEGEFYFKYREGQGTLYSEGVKVYEGEWEDDMRCGQGTQFDLMGNKVYEGLWHCDHPKES